MIGDYLVEYLVLLPWGNRVGELGKSGWGIGELGNWGIGEVGKWGSGEVGKLSHHPITPKPYHPKTLSPYFLRPEYRRLN